MPLIPGAHEKRPRRWDGTFGLAVRREPFDTPSTSASETRHGYFRKRLPGRKASTCANFWQLPPVRPGDGGVRQWLNSKCAGENAQPNVW